jgi:DNA polymerase-3 subunit epsilon
MSEQLFEFEEDASADAQVAEQRDFPIRDYQIAQIRDAFAQAGVTDQAERKSIIESCVFRDVASVREVRADEVRRILQRIAQRVAAASRPVGGSAWDDREEDTWIDKL